MIIYKALAVSLAAFASCAAARIIASDEVPLIGPTFLSNFDISKSEALCAAKSAFPDVLESLFSSQTLNRTDLLFGIDVFSASTNKSIYSYFHVGEGQDAALTAGEFSDRTIARIGSVTKLFTTYGILVQAGIEVFSHPVTRYLPELASNSSNDAFGRIRWEDITVGALASHQAGTGGAIGELNSLSCASKVTS
jgi:CubicO group peptidase (beta-lactamase class C family)